jgi:hypothetical protein
MAPHSKSFACHRGFRPPESRRVDPTQKPGTWADTGIRYAFIKTLCARIDWNGRVRSGFAVLAASGVAASWVAASGVPLGGTF